MRVLGIESSCDESAAAVVEDGRRILASVVSSQENLHRPFQGIVPEIASRAHLSEINSLIETALLRAAKKSGWRRGRRHPGAAAILGGGFIDAIAVTVGPGLVGSLLVGKVAADALSLLYRLPLVGVNHLEAHLLSALLDHPGLEPPFLGLIVSGGHTDLVWVKDFGRYQVLGRTRDDAAGECFDKAARILGVGYPGGPNIDRLARSGRRDAVAFSRPHLHGSWDFSFSGLKTAVLYHVEPSANRRAARIIPAGHRKRPAGKALADFCASLQGAVVDVLVRKLIRAAEEFGVRDVAVGGGVAANSELRRTLLERGKKEGLKIHLPSLSLCTDNAAMVACAGSFKFERLAAAGGARREDALAAGGVNASLPIRNWAAA